VPDKLGSGTAYNPWQGKTPLRLQKLNHKTPLPYRMRRARRPACANLTFLITEPIQVPPAKCLEQTAGAATGTALL
jgi:hypothetical protein